MQVLKYIRRLSHFQEYSPDVQRMLAKVLQYERSVRVSLSVPVQYKMYLLHCENKDNFLKNLMAFKAQSYSDSPFWIEMITHKVQSNYRNYNRLVPRRGRMWSCIQLRVFYPKFHSLTLKNCYSVPELLLLNYYPGVVIVSLEPRNLEQLRLILQTHIPLTPSIHNHARQFSQILPMQQNVSQDISFCKQCLSQTLSPLSASVSISHSFGPGRVILKQGHPPSAVYFIYSGCGEFNCFWWYIYFQSVTIFLCTDIIIQCQ